MDDLAGKRIITGIEGKRYKRSLETFYKKIRPAGIVLFSRNIESFDQLRSFISDIVKLSLDTTGRVPIISIDEEGGKVSRLSSDMPKFSSAYQLGLSKDIEKVENAYEEIGLFLAEVGINLDFAPVVDIRDQNSKLLRNRTFSEDPFLVSDLGLAALRGLKKAGLYGCVKHFPGHGGTLEDSHHLLPLDNRERSVIIDKDIRPFKAAIDNGVEFIMTAHVLYPFIDKDYPATLSKKIMLDILRDQLDYKNIVITDDIDMKGLSLHERSEKELVRLLLEAQADLILICNDLKRTEKIHESLKDIIFHDEIPSEDLERSKERVDRIIDSLR